MFDQLIKIDTEQFKCETQMLTVDEGVLETKQMVVIVLVIFAVELRGISGVQMRRVGDLCDTRSNTETSIILWLK